MKRSFFTLLLILLAILNFVGLTLALSGDSSQCASDLSSPKEIIQKETNTRLETVLAKPLAIAIYPGAYVGRWLVEPRSCRK